MPSQAPLTDQLRRAVGVLNRAGLYDAADWVRDRVDWPRDVPHDLVEQVMELIEARKPIQAIVLARREMGWDLATAKAWVQSMRPTT